MGGQQQTAVGPSAGGLPFQNPGLAVLQHHALTQAVTGIGVHAAGDAALTHGQTIEAGAAAGDGLEHIVLRLPAVDIGVLGTVGGVVDVVGEVVDRVLIVAAGGAALIGVEVEPTVRGADFAAFDLEFFVVGLAVDVEGQAGVVFDGAVHPLGVEHAHGADAHIAFAGDGHKNLVVDVLVALMEPVGHIDDLAADVDIGHIQRKGVGHLDGATGVVDAKGGVVEVLALFDHQVDVRVGDTHHLRTGDGGGGAVVHGVVAADLRQGGAVDGVTQQTGGAVQTGGHEQGLYAGNVGVFQIVGVVHLRKINGTRGGVGHIGGGAGILVGTGDEGVVLGRAGDFDII